MDALEEGGADVLQEGELDVGANHPDVLVRLVGLVGVVLAGHEQGGAGLHAADLVHGQHSRGHLVQQVVEAQLCSGGPPGCGGPQGPLLACWRRCSCGGGPKGHLLSCWRRWSYCGPQGQSLA